MLLFWKKLTILQHHQPYGQVNGRHNTDYNAASHHTDAADSSHNAHTRCRPRCGTTTTHSPGTKSTRAKHEPLRIKLSILCAVVSC